MISVLDLEQLQLRHPNAQFFVHDGYCGWSYGCPLNPIPVTLKTAARLLRIVCRLRPYKEVLSELEIEPSAIEYADEHSQFYQLTSNNRFLAFISPKLCGYRDETTDQPIPPPPNLVPIHIPLPDTDTNG